MRIACALRACAACIALLVVGALLGGCASARSGGSTAGAAAPGGALAHEGDLAARHVTPSGAPRRRSLRLPAARASGPVSVAAAEAFAHSVNLSASDVPGADARKRKIHSGPRARAREKRALAECLGIQPVHEIVDVKSPQLDRGAGIEGESFTSSVTVVAHPAEATREIEAVRRFHGQPCLVRFLRRSVLEDSRGRTRLVALHISLLPTHVLGAAASAGLRVEVVFSAARGTRVAFYTDELAFAVGSAEVELGASSLAQPVASTTEQQLLSLLAQRARAYVP
jgi:hypothetical protein